jgi:two-component system cell cycle sensor histidine kinase/response regulator CckA
MTSPFLRKYLLGIPIRWKLYLSVSGLLILMGTTVLLVTERQMTTAFYRELSEDGIATGRLVATNAVTPVLTDDLMALHLLVNNALQGEEELKYVFILSPQKKVLAHTFHEGFPTELLTASTTIELANQSFHRELVTDEGVILETVFPILNGNAGYVFVGMSQEIMLSSIREMRINLFVITALLFAFGSIVTLILNQLIIHPISSLVAATKKIGRGELDFEMSEERNDEIGILTKAFNEMAKSLQINRSKREQTEKALKESKDLYLSLIENIELGISFIDKNHDIVVANSAQARLFDIDSATVPGKKCYQEFAKRSTICLDCPGVIAMQEDRPVSKQTERTRDDGTVFTISAKTFPVKDDSGAILGFIEIVEDITEQLLLDEELQNIEHIDSIGQLAGGLAHDFNNLLAAIVGNIELAQLATSPEEPAFQRLNSAEEACGQARVLANQLLTFAKGGAPQKTTTSIPQLLEDSCLFALSGTNLKWVLDAPDNIWPAELDRGQIGQVIQSLLINAKEASTGGDKIFVIAENIEVENGQNLPLDSGKYIKISIDDEGHGIGKEVLPKIFDPYFTTKNMGSVKGTGLGLTICHSIVKKHGGHITVKSREDRGTSVTVYLPRSASEATTTPYVVESPVESTKTGSHRVLLLEDDRELAKTTTNLLVHLRHKSEIASTGEEAVALHLQAKDEGHPYDLLILDLTIRGGMGGKETLQKIRATDQEVKAIVSSGYSDHPILVNFKEHGFSSALPKPFTIADLEAAIQSAFTPAEKRPL